MCKARVDVIQQNPYSLPRRSLILFGNQNQGLRVVLNTKRSLNYTGAATHIMWMKMVQNDMDSNKLTWTEAVNLAQNRPLCKALQTVAVVLQWQSFDLQAATPHADVLCMFQSSGSHHCCIRHLLPLQKSGMF